MSLPARSRTFVVALSVGAAVFGTITAAAAHDRWVQSYAPIVSVGQQAYVDVMLGNHGQDHQSYRLAGTLHRDDVQLRVIDPRGHTYNLDATVFSTGEADVVPPPGPKGYLSGAFVPVEAGLYTVTAVGEAVLQHGDGPAFRNLSLAKTVLAAGPDATLGTAGAWAPPEHLAALDRLELMPEVNSAALTPGAAIVLRALYQNEPVAGLELSLIRRSTAESEVYETDAGGRVRFSAGAPDYYLVRAGFQDQSAVGDDFALTAYEATFTYIVQHEPAGLRSASGAPGPDQPWLWLLVGGITGITAFLAGRAIGGPRGGESL
ncbi:MAG: DUF4198 domain-containing protein [Thermaerobacterales bacterium]